jgi:hypothetical protein
LKLAVISAEALAKLGFSDQIEARPAYDAFIIAGIEGSGKTDWALTAPKPLFLMSSDFGDKGVIQKHVGDNPRGYPGQIVKKDYKLKIPTNLYDKPVGGKEDASSRQARESELAKWIQANFIEPFSADYRKALDAGFKTIVWDNAVDIWEYVRLSVFGRAVTNRQDLQTEANTKFRELVRESQVKGANLIMINHLKSEWADVEDGRGGTKPKKLDTFYMQGNDKQPYMVAVVLWTQFVPPDTWRMTVKKCRDNPAMTGITLDNMNFADTVALLMPDVPAEDWNR